ncbi:MAG: MotA/TolQ/ExbB proton channel family protein [Oscillospiraceae bacterium]|nr:MotA/TolQ/ExbB proton channel family protein [Oscillospiraceae bacterium]
MNITLIIGVVLAFAALLYAIIDVGGAVAIPMFFSFGSFLIVMVGTIATVVASYPVKVLKDFPKYLKIAFLPPKNNPVDYIKQVEDFATTARSKGLLALEDGASKCEDPFLKQAIMLIVDANDPDKVRSMLEDAIDFTTERHSIAWTFCEKMMSLAPAFGMMGTVISLVIMLNSLGEDTSQLGPLMAIAMITTLYGSLFANILFGPLRSALKNAHDKEILCMQLVVEGVMSIAAGSNPRLIKEKLEFMLAKSDVKNNEKAAK